LCFHKQLNVVPGIITLLSQRNLCSIGRLTLWTIVWHANNLQADRFQKRWLHVVNRVSLFYCLPPDCSVSTIQGLFVRLVSLNYCTLQWSNLAVLSLNMSTVNICHCCECWCVEKPIVVLTFGWQNLKERIFQGSNSGSSNERIFIRMIKIRSHLSYLFLFLVIGARFPAFGDLQTGGLTTLTDCCLTIPDHARLSLNALNVS
jgi:hypothetical protein